MTGRSTNGNEPSADPVTNGRSAYVPKASERLPATGGARRRRAPTPLGDSVAATGSRRAPHRRGGVQGRGSEHDAEIEWPAPDNSMRPDLPVSLGLRAFAPVQVVAALTVVLPDAGEGGYLRSVLAGDDSFVALLRALSPADPQLRSPTRTLPWADDTAGGVRGGMRVEHPLGRSRSVAEPQAGARSEGTPKARPGVRGRRERKPRSGGGVRGEAEQGSPGQIYAHTSAVLPRDR